MPRYRYLSPRAPAAGNRNEAERQLADGIKARDGGRLEDAADNFRLSVRSDPSYYEAEFQLKQYGQSLARWETALAIHPDSTDARYNFALTLAAANFPVDAANELEKVVAVNPDEARAHLALGNLYADPLGDNSRARTHYQKVLELSPNHAEATAIRYWLVSNPQ